MPDSPPLPSAAHRVSYCVNRLANAQVRACGLLILAMGLVMAVVVLLQVGLRYFTHIPLPWSEELARYLMIWLAMCGSVVALRRGRHIGVRVFVELLPPGVYDRFFVPFVQLAIIAFLGVLAREGFSFALFNLNQTSPGLNLSMFWPQLAVPVGAAMMILDLVADMLEDRWPTPAGSRAKLATAVFMDESKAQACPGTPPGGGDAGEERP